jgi:hypothetical protein
MIENSDNKTLAEILSQEGLKTLQLPKPGEVPELSADKINSLFPINPSMAQEQIDALIRYYHAQPLLDQWKDDHVNRRRWRNEKIKEFGEEFIELYEKSNKFRANLALVVVLNLEILAKLTDNEHFAKLIKKTSNLLKNLFVGYYKMTMEEKIKVLMLTDTLIHYILTYIDELKLE